MNLGNEHRQIRLKQLPQTKQILKLIGRIKLADLMELSENEFAKIIKEIENDPLFKKLFSPSNRQEKVVSYIRFPESRLARSFYELKEDIAVDRSSPNIESFLHSRKQVVPLIKRLGIDKFKKYFLYNDGQLSYKDISLACNLGEKEVRKIMTLTDDFSIQSEFFNPSTINVDRNISYSKVAKIEKYDSGDFVISFFSPHLVKGRYWINYEKLAELKNRALSHTELRKINKLVHTLKAINARKSIIYQIIRKVLKKQSIYFATSNSKNLVSLSQRELAKDMNVNPSIISRAIARRSIETPWGEEYPIKYFLPNRKRIIKKLITDIINDGKCIRTDEGIREKLRKDFNIDISRRSVASYRQELKIPRYSDRARSCKVK
ncbi:hypothetical protein GTN66_02155 [bacterium]|nr:hypothetical protein [bacterium]NIN92018.1 hypothetical protein [bacterium]NIO18234.1 hypothetical protein [bacterium]NIO73208.1 hypothetical protein [bacterium]